MIWQTSRFRLGLERPLVMGIVNVTPDSFSDGGQFDSAPSALAHCEQLLKQGADVLDIGAESSRPGAAALPLADEWARLEPVLQGALTLGVPISVDTYKPDIMQAALEMGADIINDIFALRAPGAIDVVAKHPSCGVCLMHMQGEPQSMQAQPQYQDVVQEVQGFLQERVEALRQVHVAKERLVLDPGYGFGKTLAHNVALQRGQSQLLGLGLPLMVGWSRKNSLGLITGQPVDQRMVASVAAALAAVVHGAKILRVHDVRATVEALKVWTELVGVKESS